MSHIEEELRTQPCCWEAACALAGDVERRLPARGERVAVVGCGTSLFIAQAYAARREQLGQGETDAFPASEFPSRRHYDRVVAITRSGTTTEVLQVLQRRHPDTSSVVITAASGSAAASLAEADVVLDVAAERSVVQTRFPTTVLALLRATLGDTLVGAIDDARRALDGPLPFSADRYRQVTFLGSGWSVGIAHEAALKCREVAGVWAESYPAMEYRHGPIAVSEPGTAVMVFGPAPAGLTADIEATGAALVTSALDPMADLVGVQRLAVALAHRRGLDPDRPRSLSYSVILEFTA